MENLLFEISGKRRAKAPKQTPINFANIYNCYATFLKTIKSYDAAALYYDRSLEFNPMSTDTLFSLADLYRIQGCWEEFEEILHRVHPMAYTRKQLSKCYESYYYLAMERKQYKLASVLCHMAQRFGSEDTMQEELDELIDSKLCKVTKPSVLKMREMCKKHDIPFGHNPSIAEEAARVAAILTDKHPWAAFELFGVASELTSDPKYREEMQKLVKRIIKVVHVEHFEPRGDEEIEEFEEGEKEDEEMEEFEEGEEEDEEMEEDEE